MEKRWLWIIGGTVALGTLAVALLIVALVSPAARVTAPAPTLTSDEVGQPRPHPTASAPTPPPVVPAGLAEPTCENIMAPDFHTEWLPARMDEPEPLFADGIQCWWAVDPTVGTDVVLVYGWAPASTATWDALVAERTAETETEWFTERGDRGTYLTHKTDYWVRDDEGYGSAYLFTGDAILYAQTKAETDDVVGPPSS